MFRPVVLGLLLCTATFAAAQYNPANPQPNPTYPNQPQTGQPQTTQPQVGQPLPPTQDATAAVPPTFNPGGSQRQSAPTAVRISGGVMAGLVMNRVDPVYPAEAKADHVQGAVVLSAHINKEGRIESLATISGPAPLQRAAVEAVKQWTYKPYLLNGQPVAVHTTVTVNFYLTNPQAGSPQQQ